MPRRYYLKVALSIVVAISTENYISDMRLDDHALKGKDLNVTLENCTFESITVVINDANHAILKHCTFVFTSSIQFFFLV